ncbi:MAG: hypothetical protein V7636_1674, partial [Actinomycetota bacterium]
MLLDVPVHVLDGGLDDVQRITKLVELGTRDDELRFAESELGGSTSALIVDLSTGLATELAWTTWARTLLDRSTAPPAPLRALGSRG